jgi:hypothetical protein
MRHMPENAGQRQLGEAKFQASRISLFIPEPADQRHGSAAGPQETWVSRAIPADTDRLPNGGRRDAGRGCAAGCAGPVGAAAVFAHEGESARDGPGAKGVCQPVGGQRAVGYMSSDGCYLAGS